MKAQLIATCLFLSFAGWTQPSTEVYLFDLDLGDVPAISNPTNISNNAGYDNQPAFWPDGNSVLYARSYGNQTDIARYFISTGKTERITSTLQGGEYSPTPTPNNKISSIRLDTTGLQLLYEYDMEGNDRVLIPELVIGYHAWLDNEYLIAFVLGDIPTLHLINSNSDEDRIMAEKIGRSLHKIPDMDYFSYVDKSDTSKWVIRAMKKDGTKDRLIDTVKGAEDYCWTPDGKMIMGQGSMLYYWEDGGDWKVFADLADYGMDGITRMTVAPDGRRLAVVVNE